MHLALTLNPFVDTDLLYAQQLGVDWIVADVSAWDRATLAAAHNRVEKAGLCLGGLTCLPTSLLAGALSDSPQAEEAVARICRIVADAGALGIASLGYRWPPADSERAPGSTTGRGRALSAVYSIREAKGDVQQDRRRVMWQRLSAFLARVLPAAEAAGVQLAYRTELAQASPDPAVRILDSVDELDRLFEVAGSPCHGLDLDHGFVDHVLCPQAGLPAAEVIRHLGGQGRILTVRLHSLRAVDGSIVEIFPDEDSVATLSALQAYRASGFAGLLIPVVAPDMAEDTVWRHKGTAFAVGYARALLQALG